MKFVPAAMSRGVGRSVLQAKASSPHIFFGIGLAGMVASTILACRATLKLNETLDEIEKDLDAARESKDPKHGAIVLVRSAASLTKLYGPAVAVGTVSVACLTGSHVQLTRRNTALMAAYATLQKAFDEYRDRVEEHFNEPTGKGAKKEESLGLAGPWSPYARFFDEGSTQFTKDAELNRLYITCQQTYVNQLLLVRGHVFLNEVYDALGLDRSKEGAVVGWVYPSKDGDNYISFGLDEPRNAHFFDGSEPRVLLDFNVDGVVYDLI